MTLYGRSDAEYFFLSMSSTPKNSRKDPGQPCRKSNGVVGAVEVEKSAVKWIVYSLPSESGRETL